MTNVQIFVYLFLKRWFQFDSRIVRTRFANVVASNNLEMIAETRSQHFQMTFSLSSTSSLLKLPNFTRQRDGFFSGPLSEIA